MITKKQRVFYDTLKVRFKGEGNPMSGKKHSRITRKRMCEAHDHPPTKKQLAYWNRGTIKEPTIKQLVWWASQRGAGNPHFGMKHSETAKRLISKKLKKYYGDTLTEKQRAHHDRLKLKFIGMGNPHFGMKHSEETKTRLAEMKRGCIISTETRRKISHSLMERYRITPYYSKVMR